MSINRSDKSEQTLQLEESEIPEAPEMMATVISSLRASSFSVEEILKEFNTHETNGLPNDEIERRRMLHGWNEFDVSEETPLWRKYLDQVKFVLFTNYFGFESRYLTGSSLFSAKQHLF